MVTPDPQHESSSITQSIRNQQPDSIFSEFDLYLFGQGKDYNLYEKMGAHFRIIDGIQGVNFAVWAPNALSVSVIGDFNEWDRGKNSMRLRHRDLGVWECFIPEAQIGMRYKYAILSRYHHYQTDRYDPYGFAAEVRPNTASIIADIHQYSWHDSAWISTREQHQALNTPISIYEVHLGSWRRAVENGHERLMNYREIAHELADYVQQLGFTHVELLPISEYPFDGSWGYQVTGYFAPTSRFGSPTDFQYFVDFLHQQGIGVILDWVPGHFPKDGFALNYFDGTHLYEYADPRMGEHKEWGTLVFNYGRNEVKNFLVSNALFWLREYHVDGLRVDAVASMLYLDYVRDPDQWLPNKYGGREHLEAVEFLRQFNDAVHEYQPSALTIAEESTSWPLVTYPTYLGGLGFNLKWNMGWMHDVLDFMEYDPIHRSHHQNNITFSLMYAYSENFVLPFSHDEVVHLKKSMISKMPGDLWQKFANLRALYGYMWGHPGKKLLFMGDEFGQWGEWNFAQSLDWHLLQSPDDPLHSQLSLFVRDLNCLYKQEPALSLLDYAQQGFSWIDCNDSQQSVVSFIRRAKNDTDTLIFICNFTPVVRTNYRVGAPFSDLYVEVLNSDSTIYGGSGVVNSKTLSTNLVPWHSYNQSLCLTLPPLSTIVLKCSGEPSPTDK